MRVAGMCLALATMFGGGGQATEDRFPPLQVPAGFKATLFACDPLIEYPSAVALGPRHGSIFVAVDYLTGLGPEITQRDEVRLVEDTDGDGKADRAPVFADKFNSIQGLTYWGDTLYVMHAPFLTALRDKDGDGKADERIDLLSGLGLRPEDNSTRLHCANGLVMGHDGWLYLALGDNGCRIPRKGKDDLMLEGGGILRCRADGSQVHVFSKGLRNPYDVALDEDLNVFVRDNENDGGDYMIRYYHTFFGADHGYPYLYNEHPDECMPPLADLGRGSSAGGLCYLETAFPKEYRGNLFFCEWGKSIVRFPLEKQGSGFAKGKEIEFAVGDPKDKYPFKPTDLVVERDGSLIVVDWADGQRPKRGRGRIYRIGPEKKGKMPEWPTKATTPVELLKLLDLDSSLLSCEAHRLLKALGEDGRRAIGNAWSKMGTRSRSRAVWHLDPARLGALTGKKSWSNLDVRIKVQLIRLLGDLLGRKDSVKSKNEWALPILAELALDEQPMVYRETVIALGRAGWQEAPKWLGKTLSRSDPALDHAVVQTLRSSANWQDILMLIDLPPGELIRPLALRALAEQWQPVIVDGLLERLAMEDRKGRCLEYVTLLSRVWKKPGPWKYWGYRPAPRPPHTVAWERTEAIGRALNALLTDADLRLPVLKLMQREQIPVDGPALLVWLKSEKNPEAVGVLLDSLASVAGEHAKEALEFVIRAKEQTVANRLKALAAWGTKRDVAQWLALAETLEDGPVLESAVRLASVLPADKAKGFVLAKTKAGSAEVRVAALDVLGGWKLAEAGPRVIELIDDSVPAVRRAAALAVMKLGLRSAADKILVHCGDADASVRDMCLQALLLFKDQRGVAAARACLQKRQNLPPALEYLRATGGRDDAGLVAEIGLEHPTPEVVAIVVPALTTWEDPSSPGAETRRTIAEIQGASGMLVRWQWRASPVADAPGAPEAATLAVGPDARWKLQGKGKMLAFSDVEVPQAAEVQFLAGSSTPFEVWHKGAKIFESKESGTFRVDTYRFGARLDKGPNRLIVKLPDVKGTAELHLRFRKTSSRADHERLVDLALNRPGSVDAGKKVFFEAKKSLCLTCHALNGQGEKIGPDLTGVGVRFSRIHLLESILEPSRAIAPSYDSVAVELKSGRLVIGVVVAETAEKLILADNQGKRHELAKADIEERRRHPQSIMPEGLEQRLTPDELVDLVAFLLSQRTR